MSVVVSEGVDVVVCNYRTPDDLRTFGISYLQQDYPSHLIIVNVSPTAEDIEVAEWLLGETAVTYVEFEENCGYAKAINYGASLSSFPIVAAFNADVELPFGVLRQCCERFLSMTGSGVYGPIQVDDRGRLTHAGIFGSNQKPSFEGAWQQAPTEKHRVQRDAISVSGAAYFVKRSVWEELTTCPVYREVFPEALGALLPTPFYYEELGCSLHARAHGFDVIYDGTVEPPLVHRWHGSVKANKMEKIAGQWMGESLDMFRGFCDRHGIDHE